MAGNKSTGKSAPEQKENPQKAPVDVAEKPPEQPADVALSKEVADDQKEDSTAGTPVPPTPLEEPEAPADTLLIGGSFRLSVLLSKFLDEEGVSALTTLVRDAFNAGEVPLHMQVLLQTVPTQAAARYLNEAKRLGVDPDSIEFVIADPEQDSSLKSINFMRGMQGLSPTYFYPRLL